MIVLNPLTLAWSALTFGNWLSLVTPIAASIFSMTWALVSHGPVSLVLIGSPYQ